MVACVKGMLCFEIQQRGDVGLFHDRRCTYQFVNCVETCGQVDISQSVTWPRRIVAGRINEQSRSRLIRREGLRLTG